jgi:pimeloyl-ACP methyl ester carboxylesterase
VQHLGLARFHVVATAAGGIGGLDYAVEHPERVRSLVVANSIGGVQDPEYLEVQHRLRPPEIQRLPIELRELGPSYRGTNHEGTIEFEVAQQPSRGTPGARAAATAPDDVRAAGDHTSPSARARRRSRPPEPPALMRMLAAHIPNCQFVTVPEAGHAAFWEQPEIWNRLVLEFLGQH